MTYAHNVWRVSMIGDCFGGTEVWTTGFYVGDEGADVSVPTQQDADFIRGRWQTLFAATGLQAFFDTNWRTTTIKLSHIDAATGKAFPNNTVYSYYSTPIVGQSSAGTMPPQCSLVTTLTSDIPRGVASKGRMYLPGVAGRCDSSGKIAGNVSGNLSTAMQAFFNGVNTDLGIRGSAVLASKGGKAGAGINKLITGIRVGDVVDTQRRRRNNLVEIYSSKPVTP